MLNLKPNEETLVKHPEIDDLLKTQVYVKLEDLFYNKYHGRKMYRLYQEYANMDHEKSDYDTITQCKECPYETQCIVNMLEHIDYSHLPPLTCNCTLQTHVHLKSPMCSKQVHVPPRVQFL